jgi:hypothetical protein
MTVTRKDRYANLGVKRGAVCGRVGLAVGTEPAAILARVELAHALAVRRRTKSPTQPIV